MRSWNGIIAVAVLAAALTLPAAAHAGGGGTSGHETFPAVFFFIVVMLLFGRIGALAERYRQPAVLGELLMGVALGALAFLPGLGAIAAFKDDGIVWAFAEVGVILLLFRTGLESNLGEMRKVGVPALLVACVGVALPFIGGYFAGRWLLPGHSFHTYLFLGATLTATSVGITARVFKDLGVLSSREARIVLGAAVIDDVLGLLILAVVAGIVSSGSVALGGVAVLAAKAFAFLAGSIALGIALAPRLGRLFSRIHPGVGMKMALALLFCGAYSYGAYALAGLAPIVGAFAAGLVLDPLHFSFFATPHLAAKIRSWAGRAPDGTLAAEMRAEADHEEHAHVENLVEGVANFFVPVFFVYTGLQVDLASFADLSTLGIALAISVVAFAGKVAAGLVAGRGADHALIGIGMVPRGEVGLIFANVGKQLGVIDDRIFAIAVIVVMLSTLLTPPLLGTIISRRGRA